MYCTVLYFTLVPARATPLLLPTAACYSLIKYLVKYVAAAGNYERAHSKLGVCGWMGGWTGGSVGVGVGGSVRVTRGVSGRALAGFGVGFRELIFQGSFGIFFFSLFVFRRDVLDRDTFRLQQEQFVVECRNDSCTPTLPYNLLTSSHSL